MATMNLGFDSKNVDSLGNITVPDKYYNRITTGTPLLDEIWGGQDMPGILPGASILFTGSPGAGKSTMCLQMMDLIVRNSGKKVLLNATEENKFMVKMRANRLDISSNILVSQFSELDDLLEFVLDNDVDVLVQDSLQSLMYGDREGKKLVTDIGNRVVKFANDRDVTVFLIGHITKSGDFAGPMLLKHAIDVHAHLGFSKEINGCIFTLTKNRFGPANIPCGLPMTARGVDFSLIENSEEATTRITKAQKKDEFVEKAKELLLKGEKLSGYSHTDNGDLVKWIADEWDGNCSGNWWREVLGRAEAELRSDGALLGKTKINRRDHVYVEVN